MNPEKPPKGMIAENMFWVDHFQRIGGSGDCECTCDEPDDNYGCLLNDARFYAGTTEWDMPGWGSLIRSARGVVKSFEGGPVYRHSQTPH
jgi:hypothetical protein